MDSPQDSDTSQALTHPLAESQRIPRRALLKGVAALAALGSVNVSGVIGATDAGDKAVAKTEKLDLKKGAVIVFQGDSITDAGRKKNDGMAWTDSGALGNGYPAMAAGQLLADYPDRELQVINRGVSGNKVPDLAARWQADAIDLKPTILSILVGINDLWHTIAFGSKYKGTVADYETGYRDLLQQTRDKVPGVELVVCEPFTLRDWPAFDPYRAVARKLADEMKLTFVPLQQVFSDAAKTAPNPFWLWDGIHPTPAGHALLLQAWRRVVGV
ncbi:MAG: lipolytic protein G-D-S-L family [Phycisphaera sp.]|nr:lipolytic protein G-D-S-L family [Phycisphaera sp.]